MSSIMEEADSKFTPFFDLEVPINDRLNVEPDEDPDLTVTNFSIQLSIKQTDDELEAIRIQIYSKDNINFLFKGNLTAEEFEEFRKEQELEIDFNDFPNVLQEVLSQVNVDIIENEGYNAILQPDTENSEAARLIVKQDLELCTTEIFNIKLEQATAEEMRYIAQDRYNRLNKKFDQVKTNYKDLMKRINRQDPSILRNFKSAFAEE